MRRLQDDDDIDALKDLLSVDFLLLTLLFTGMAAMMMGVVLYNAYIQYRWPVTMHLPSSFFDFSPAKRGVSDRILRADVKGWLKENRIRARTHSDVQEIKFRTQRDAVLFKMRWM